VEQSPTIRTDQRNSRHLSKVSVAEPMPGSAVSLAVDSAAAAAAGDPPVLLPIALATSPSPTPTGQMRTPKARQPLPLRIGAFFYASWFTERCWRNVPGRECTRRGSSKRRKKRDTFFIFGYNKRSDRMYQVSHQLCHFCHKTSFSTYLHHALTFIISRGCINDGPAA